MLSRNSPLALPEDTGEEVAFFSQAATFRRLWPSIADRLNEVFDDGKFSHGAQVAALERELAAYTGAGFVLGVNSGTDALVLLLRACGLRPGDGVLVPAYSFVATASSVVLAGGRPQFVDVEPASYAMDPAALERAITPESRMVMPTHLFHAQADMAAIGAIAERHGLTLVEDSAEGIGMRQRGVHAGLHGRGGVLSFFPSKTLGAIGDAGAVLTDDPAVAATVGALRHHGRYGRTLAHFPGIANETALPGVNSKMDDFQAAVLRAKLPDLDGAIERRAALAAAYTERLRDVPGVRRLPEPHSEGPGERGVFYVYLVEVERRDALAAHLAARGIGTETYYPRSLHRQPCFAELGYGQGAFPVAEAASRHALALPFHPDLTDDQVRRVCEAVAAFYRAGGGR
ncbi:aminotransferase class I/II-fold pyridoxal phosphate-dependent enzyme [Streptomyces sp. 3MP-14]|uniref:Aminotransferase class I/II-fold pyridoxal phosphate-dependent enzyme n=1 Tax=Streptomyces mimosae TaxID=2586635 RepID=A0A5N6A1Q4_9ACTN|nr:MULTISPECIES: DegT/DnrJ/EryC1/StrS family aminotransferase [Streptomyces]KAB8161268.1 aminotransferase class I/II-fold pyridoxal phosphate-dependent enzyme [Streptomyces mimosae]KAB8173070.1 aminotransferase class I/II-fold pyridoxal phosphate-dependent enzyme [Streptomyces sp. 3MP-14]